MPVAIPEHVDLTRASVAAAGNRLSFTFLISATTPISAALAAQTELRATLFGVGLHDPDFARPAGDGFYLATGPNEFIQLVHIGGANILQPGRQQYRDGGWQPLDLEPEYSLENNVVTLTVGLDTVSPRAKWFAFTSLDVEGGSVCDVAGLEGDEPQLELPAPP